MSGSDTLLVDKTKPNVPTVRADRAPEYSAGGESWYRDSATLSFAATDDPDLADGTDGSGTDPASLPGAATYGTTGTHTASGTVNDHAGNTSDAASKTVKVDATDPSLTVTCPETVYLNGRAEATTEASDGESGLASAPTAAVDASSVGPKTVTVTAPDKGRQYHDEVVHDQGRLQVRRLPAADQPRRLEPLQARKHRVDEDRAHRRERAACRGRGGDTSGREADRRGRGRLRRGDLERCREYPVVSSRARGPGGTSTTSGRGRSRPAPGR